MAPFGVSNPRFQGFALHPNLDQSGVRLLGPGPGAYDPQYPSCPYAPPPKNTWTLKRDAEQFSRSLGYKNEHILQERQFRRASGGPGSYDLPELPIGHAVSSFRNVSFGLARRFQEEVRSDAPGPGAYGVPDDKRRHRPDHGCKTTVPIFEWDGFKGRFSYYTPAFHLAPNLYRPRDKEPLLRKMVSRRGPYDCFTGPRDYTTIRNHFAPPLLRDCHTLYSLPSEMDRLQQPRKARYGKWSRTGRFTARPTVRHMLNDLSMCWKDPSLPGPAHYYVEVDNIKRAPPLKHPFNNSMPDARPGVKRTLLPGPGRYDPKPTRCLYKKGASWPFLSRTERTTYKPPDYSAF